MQIQPLLSLAAAALSLGAAAAQSAPRVLTIDEAPAVGVRLAAPRAHAAPAPAQAPAAVRAELPTALGGITATPSQPLGAIALGPAAQDAGAQQGFLGVNLSQAEGESGATVSGLVAGAPAEKAGLREGDRITAVDGQPVADASALTAAVRGKKPGTGVTLTIARGDSTLEQTVTLGARSGGAVALPALPSEPSQAAGAPGIGSGVQLRVLNTDDDEDDDEDDDAEDDDEHESEAQEARPRRVRMRTMRNAGGASGEAPRVFVAAPGMGGDGEHRVEVRAESQGEGGKVRVWVNGEEVDPGEGHGAWIHHAEGLEHLKTLGVDFGDLDFDVDVDLEGLDFAPMVGGAHTFRFEGAAPGQHGDVRVVRKRKAGDSEEQHGQFVIEGHEAPMVLHRIGHADDDGEQHEIAIAVGPPSELAKRVSELEGQVRDLSQKVRELERALDGMRNPHPAVGGRMLSVEGPEPSQVEGQRRPRVARIQAGDLAAPIEVRGVEIQRADRDDDNDELRKEIRDLMRAIERLEKRSAGGGR